MDPRGFDKTPRLPRLPAHRPPVTILSLLSAPLIAFVRRAQGSWTISLMIPCVICYGMSAVAWGLLYSSDAVDFDNMGEPRTRIEGGLHKIPVG
jgi:hypothetical protein